MGYRYDRKIDSWIAYASKRHPLTRVSKSLRRKAKTKAEAIRLEKQLIAEIERKFLKETVPDWQVCIERMLESFKDRGITEKTIDCYWRCLKAHTLPDWEERPINSITTQEIRDLIKEKVGHRSPSHQKNMLKFIRSVFTFGIEIGAIQRDPTPRMKFRIGDKIKKVLTEEQVRFFLNKAKTLGVEWYPHWATAVYTGMRNGELYALTWDKVNIKDRQMLVDSSWNNKDGFKSTKSGDDRWVEIAPNLVPLLQELKLQSDDTNFVLPRIDKWDKGEQARELRMFLTGIGLPTIRFHDLRATWATLLLAKGVEPIKVMIMGGWKDLKTMQIYVRKAGVDIKGTTDCLDLHSPSSETARILVFNDRGEK